MQKHDRCDCVQTGLCRTRHSSALVDTRAAVSVLEGSSRSISVFILRLYYLLSFYAWLNKVIGSLCTLLGEQEWK